MTNARPNYYHVKTPYEVDGVLESWGLNAFHYRAEAIQYIMRAHQKGEELKDLEKARYRLECEIERLKKDEVPSNEKSLEKPPPVSPHLTRVRQSLQPLGVTLTSNLDLNRFEAHVKAESGNEIVATWTSSLFYESSVEKIVLRVSRALVERGRAEKSHRPMVTSSARGNLDSVQDALAPLRASIEITQNFERTAVLSVKVKSLDQVVDTWPPVFLDRYSVEEIVEKAVRALVRHRKGRERGGSDAFPLMSYSHMYGGIVSEGGNPSGGLTDLPPGR